jgi:hypothetical protein
MVSEGGVKMTVIKLKTRWEIDAAREARQALDKHIAEAEAARDRAVRARSAGRVIEVASRFYRDASFFEMHYPLTSLKESERIGEETKSAYQSMLRVAEDKHLSPYYIGLDASNIVKTKERVGIWFHRYLRRLENLRETMDSLVRAA